MDDVSAAFGPQSYTTRDGATWPSCFAVGDLAVTSMGAVGSAMSDLIAALGLGPRPEVIIDRRLASLWFSWSIQPIGWEKPPLWDPIAGDYQTRDGWIRLHTNAPHHRAAALSVLKSEATRETVAEAVAKFDADALETEIVNAQGAAAALRSRAEWQTHPQGQAVAAEPLVDWVLRDGQPRDWAPTYDRPLAGLRVLDLTRVLAGPVASRTLAGFGAQILRIDPPDWDEPGVAPDVTLGKRCSRLDLRQPGDLSTFETLLSRADILIHGYRAGALDGLIAPARRTELAPGLIEVSLNAYGWHGPWSGRRGFDSLVQMSSGIADTGARWAHTDAPHPLPVQALDHATGYFMAAAALTGLTRALGHGRVGIARLSLARTAELLTRMSAPDGGGLEGARAGDFSARSECTVWGEARRLKPAIEIAGCPLRWDLPASPLGSAPPLWI